MPPCHRHRFAASTRGGIVALCAWTASLAAATLPRIAIGAQQAEKLGTITFPTSGSVAAQPAFIRGMLLYYSFEYDRAAAAFREAQKADPSFALAYWGEALTHTHQVWNEQDLPAARAALARLAPTAAARRAKVRTARERAYFALAEALCGDGPKPLRDTLFNAAAEQLERAYPHEDEPKVLHALGLLGLNQGDRDIPAYMEAGAIAEGVLRHNPDHPGAAHFVIHAFDDPDHAPLGLWAARLYSGIAPGAPHAQHMTSHIFLAAGLWDDVIAANVRASGEQQRRMAAAGRPERKCGHYAEWLQYGLLQAGRRNEARAMLDACAGAPTPDSLVDDVEGYAGFRAAQVVDAGVEGIVRPSDAVPRRTPGARAYMAFGDGYVAWLTGNTAGITSALAKIRAESAAESPRPDPYVRILATELQALDRAANNDLDAAISYAESAARADDALPVPFGPPQTAKPPHELLGDILLRAGNSARALTEFRIALAHAPGRSHALFGIARAALAAGDTAAARAAAGRLRANWHAADKNLPELAELDRLAPKPKE